jgi:hypothetical protein
MTPKWYSLSRELRTQRMNASKTEDSTNSSRVKEFEFEVQFEDQMLQSAATGIFTEKERKRNCLGFRIPTTVTLFVGPKHRNTLALL